MARFAVIGLGTFGGHVVRALFKQGHEVIAIDRESERVQDLREECSQPIVADCTDKPTLHALGLDSADAVVLSLGQRMDASILVTLYLKEMGVRRIVAKAISADHGRILELIGATEIIHPERDTALRVARALEARSIVDYLPLGKGFSLAEVTAPESFVGRTLADIAVRRRYQVSIVAVKNGDDVELVPGGDYVVATGDVLVLVGRDEDVERLAHEGE
jgi:trk system potassium uptake protein TrkA